LDASLRPSIASHPTTHTINLTEDDLGNPPDMLYCGDAYLHDGCTARLQLVIQEYFSRRYPPMG
jgi:hypothetical protein